MKKQFIFLFSLFSMLTLFSQDVITKQNGDEIKAKILEVTNTELKYKKFDNLEGPVFTMKLNEVFMILYQNGTKEVFNSSKNVEETTQDSEQTYQSGVTDSRQYYKSYKAAGTVTLLTSLLSPLVGLVPALACSLTPPSDENLDYPSHEKMKNPDYSQGYKNKAKKTKSGKVWMNWGIGFGVNVALIFLLL